MDSEMIDIPEKYLDMLLQEFAYDPVRLPLREDPAQVLYNRTTLETIWDAKHEAVNPFTRRPLDISNLIPQGELRQEMQRYIANNSRLDVISDYTRVLSEAEMRIFMKGLVSDYERLVNVEEEKRGVRAEHCRKYLWQKGNKQKGNKNLRAEHYWKVLGQKFNHCWKVLWQKFNLLRLYCQYRRENRVVFCSIGGYEYLLQVILNGRFSFLFSHHSSSRDISKELCKIVDVIGLKDTNFPPQLLLPIATTMSCLVTRCDQAKIQGMVLRICREMFYELNIEILSTSTSRLDLFCSKTIHVTLSTLGRENFSDIANEDLYNGMAILKAAWTKYRMSCSNSESKYVGVLVDSVTLCISRLHYLHQAAITDECSRSRMVKNKNEDDEAKTVDLINVAFEGGLWLINSILTATSHEEGENEFFSQLKETLEESDIVTQIVRMMELVLAGFKSIGSPHLQFGINIMVTVVEEEGSEGRDDVVRVVGDFLGSNVVDEYDSSVKLLLQEFMHNVNASEA